ncbi:MAG: Uma2 family endonuclease [Chloroflexota bacterium]|nr:Uma2 family endonuclease [Chloroflexota bacterium]
MATTAETTSTDAARAITYADLEPLPEDISQRHEIILGELFVSPSPVPNHQFVLGNLFIRLYTHVAERRLGLVLMAPVDVKLSEYNVVVPDILFVARDRLDIVGPKAIAGAPDLVVEILSPSTARQDRIRKLALYASYGVREYWLIDPDAKALQVLTLVEGRYEPILGDGFPGSRILPDIQIDLGALFADPG